MGANLGAQTQSGDLETSPSWSGQLERYWPLLKTTHNREREKIDCFWRPRTFLN